MHSRAYINIEPSSRSPSPSESCTSAERNPFNFPDACSLGSRSGSLSPWSVETTMISGSSSPGTSPTSCVRYQATSDAPSPSHRPVSLLINGEKVERDGERHGRINLALTDSDSQRSSISGGNAITLSSTSRLLPPKPSAKQPESYLFLALVVAFFFNLPFGIIAMCVSLKSRKETERGATEWAEKLATVSLIVSLLGIFVSAFAIGLAIYFVIHNH